MVNFQKALDSPVSCWTKGNLKQKKKKHNFVLYVKLKGTECKQILQ